MNANQRAAPDLSTKQCIGSGVAEFSLTQSHGRARLYIEQGDDCVAVYWDEIYTLIEKLKEVVDGDA